MADSPEAPGWPVANIDFDAAHEAARAGKLEQHLAELEKPSVPAPAAAPEPDPEPAPEPAAPAKAAK